MRMPEWRGRKIRLPNNFFVVRAFIPLALGYLLSYFFRSVNAVIAPDLLRDLNIGAEQLGLLTSAYFFGFAAMQLPLGMLLDRFGPRYVQAGLLSIAALGAYIFSVAEQLETLTVARALIGLGVAGALMSAFMGFVHWFPARHLALANGIYMMFGGLGALLATGPVEAYLTLAPWRDLFRMLAVITLTVAGVILILTPNVSREGPPRRIQNLLGGLWHVLTDRVFWRIVPLTAVTLGSAFALQSLWAGPWLSDVAFLSRSEVATVLTAMALGLIVGSACMGVTVMVGRRFGVSTLGVFIILTVIYFAIIVGLTFRVTSLALVLWASLGILTNMLALSYVVLSHHFLATHAGRVNTSVNLVVTSTSFVLQYLVGWVVDLWPRGAGGAYPPEAYSAGIGVILILVVLAFLWFLIYRPSENAH